MIFFASILLLYLAFQNYIIANSFSYPPVVFSSLWFTVLFCLAFIADDYYPISNLTLLIITVSSIFFSLGSLASFLVVIKQSNLYIRGNQNVENLLNIAFIIILLLLPIYLYVLYEMGMSVAADNILIGIRTKTIEDGGATNQLGFFAYYISISQFIAIISFVQFIRGFYPLKKTICIVFLSLLIGISTATRMSTFMVFLPLIGVLLVSNKITIKYLAIFLPCIAMFFSVLAFILGKGASSDIGFIENIESILDSFKLYLLGGTVAFDQVATGVQHVEYGILFNFFYKIFSAIGFEIGAMQTILPYTYVPYEINVYTIFFSYYKDFGFFGLIVFMFLIGFVLSIMYRKAKLGNPLFVFLYGIGFACTVLSVLNESFIASISYWVQAVIIGYLLYGVPSLSRYKSR